MRSIPGLLEETSGLTDNREPVSLASTTITSDASYGGSEFGNPPHLMRNVSDARSAAQESFGPSQVFRESSEATPKPDEVVILKGSAVSNNDKDGLVQVAPLDLQERLKLALEAADKDGNIDRVRQVLAEGADVNGEIKYKRFTGKPLTFAVTLDNKELILFLIENGADPDSKYSFKAGAEQVIKSDPAANGAIIHKKLGILRLLHEKKATLEGRTSFFRDEPNGTMLYEACYCGSMSIIRFLLRRCKKDLEVAVKFQDDLSVTMTPLHVAAWRGHFEVVEELLKIGAKVGPFDSKVGHGPPILADAIDSGHVDICRLLVKNSADIFGGEPGMRGIDYIFKTNDIVIIAAVAAGLGANINPKCVQDMTPEDLVAFMRIPNCDEIFDAIFREKLLQDWNGRKRVFLHNAYIGNTTFKINIAEGPSHTYLMDLFKNRQEKPVEEQEKILESIYDDDAEAYHFMNHLMPGRHREKRHKISQVPVETRQCFMADIHNNVRVVWALANGPNLTAFDHHGAQALVMYGWAKTAPWYLTNFICNFCLALMFLLFAILIRKEEPSEWLYVCGCIATLLLMRQVFYEVMQMTGLLMLGHWTSYILDVGNVVDLFRLKLTAFGIIMAFDAEGWEVKDNMNIRIFMGLVMFLLWNKLLLSQRGFAIAGQRMLPILETAESLWPFLTVMIWPTLGFFTCYYMISPYDELHRAFTMVYRMGWVGDFDLEELEDIDPSFEPTEGFPTQEGSVLETVDPVFTEYHAVFLFFMLAVTFLFAIIMMNILIGVLSESYSYAYSNKHRIFLKTRAHINFEHYAVSMACTKLFGPCGDCRWHCCRRNKVQRARSIHWGGKKTPEGKQTHLWYCRPKNMDELGLPDEDDDDNAEGADNPIGLTRLLMNDLSSFKHEFHTRMDDMESRIAIKRNYQNNQGQQEQHASISGRTVQEIFKDVSDGLDELKGELKFNWSSERGAQ